MCWSCNYDLAPEGSIIPATKKQIKKIADAQDHRRQTGGNRDSELFEALKKADEYDKIKQEKAELLEALKKAIKYINESPGDPDIFPEQWEAYQEYLKAKEDLIDKDILDKGEIT